MNFPIATFVSAILLALHGLAVHADEPAPPSVKKAGLVAPVDWTKFQCRPATGDAAERFGKILLNANKYALTVWWTNKGFNQILADGYLDFKGTAEKHIRPAASEAQGLAILLRLGLYRAEATGVSPPDAGKKVIQLVRSLAHRHRANSPNGWGLAWQSPAWAAYTDMAGWLMWDELDDITRSELVQMTESEAAWVVANKGENKIKTYRDRAGKIISPGDTGLEENAWDASLLVAATAMMPRHSQSSRWMNKTIALWLSAQARPSDVGRTNIYHGKPLTEWLAGSNLNEDGTCVNHDRIHPDYMIAGLCEFSPAGFYGLARRPLPAAAVFNLETPYRALADLQFVAGTELAGRMVLPPGGTIFKPGSADVYCPQGNDWGTDQRDHFACADAVIVAFAGDAALKQRAAVWEQKHTERVLEMQARFTDGHTYGALGELNWHTREEYVAVSSSSAYLLKWLVAQAPPVFTNDKF